MESSLYISIIGDLVKSREIEDRAGVQEQLRQLLSGFNTEFEPFIAAKFVITLGDEFQGLVRRDFPFEAFFDRYDKQFGNDRPTRFGIGLGTVSTGFQETAVGMDGPCFHNAREALNQAKKSKKEIVVKGFEHNTALSALFDAMLDIRRGWSERQVEVIEKSLIAQNFNTIAEELNVSKQAVSKILSSAKKELYENTWQGIKELILMC